MTHPQSVVACYPTHMIKIDTPLDWKNAIVESLSEQKKSRYTFVRECVGAGLCAQHTAECLLAAPTTATGKRRPTLATALEIAHLAGFEVCLRLKEPPPPE